MKYDISTLTAHLNSDVAQAVTDLLTHIDEYFGEGKENNGEPDGVTVMVTVEGVTQPMFTGPLAFVFQEGGPEREHLERIMILTVSHFKPQAIFSVTTGDVAARDDESDEFIAAMVDVFTPTGVYSITFDAVTGAVKDLMFRDGEVPLWEAAEKINTMTEA